MTTKQKTKRTTQSTTHPSYKKMVIIAVNCLKKCNEKQIKKYIQTNYTKLATGARFDNAIQSAITNGMDNKFLTFDAKCGKYKITPIGKIKVRQPSKTRRKKRTVKLYPRKKKKHETATGRLTCCSKPGHKFAPQSIYAGIKVMNKAVEARKVNLFHQTHNPIIC